MPQYIELQPVDAVIGGIETVMPLSYVELRDAVSGFDGPGSYHIQLQRGSSIGGLAGQYVVTYGLAPNDSHLIMTVLRVVLTPAGDLVFSDARKLNVGNTGVNATIMQTANADGSYLADGVVTVRTIQGGVGHLLDSIGSTQGDILFRGASAWTVLTPGTSGYVLTTGGAGANPAWTNAGAGAPIVPSGTSFPGSPTAGQLFYRTDLDALFWYSGSSWLNADTLAQLNDVVLTSLANQQLLYYSSGSSKWINASLSAILDAVLGSTRGAILERGASGWQIIAPGASGYVLTANGSGADPSWQAGGGVASLNGLTGALTIVSPDGSIAISTPGGGDIALETASPGVLPVVTGEDAPPVFIYTDDYKLVYVQL